MLVAKKHSILADHCPLRTAVNYNTSGTDIRRIHASRFFFLPNFQNKLPKPVVKLFISDFLNVRIDFVVFLFAAILFNFYIAFDGPFLPATNRRRRINSFVFAGILDALLCSTSLSQTTTILRPGFSFFSTSTLSCSLTSLKSANNSSKFNSGEKGS